MATNVATGPPGIARPRRGRAGVLARASLLCVVSVALLAGVARLALGTARGQDLDERAMRILEGAPEPLMAVLGGISVGSAALAVAAFVGLALLRGRFALAGAVAVTVVGANLTTQLLKHEILVRQDVGLSTLDGMPNSLPSGHTTVVFSLVLAALLVAPRGLRAPVALLGSLVGTLTAASTVVAGWHRPSDVVAAMLVALAWGAAVLFVLAVLAPALPLRPRGPSAGVSAVLGSAVGGLLLVAVGVRPGSGPGDLLAAVLSLGAIGLASASAVGVFAQLVGRAVD
jgi:membrane-associated phospholipid phosphatase